MSEKVVPILTLKAFRFSFLKSLCFLKAGGGRTKSTEGKQEVEDSQGQIRPGIKCQE
jgi:hypothetical protein